ncbi:MAG: cyclodeaminase/cyclohydrolase family protein [Oscillospiraceae bacterium]|nr:cyclodeaminase/cyclohydrolase family protein [Oscillospiraceae bacterium]
MKTAEKTTKQFTDELASKAAVPGGGGASALVGAVAAALGNMVGSLTLGKKKYADVEAEIAALIADTTVLQEKLIELVDRDAEDFTPLAAAYGIPKDDPTRDATLQAALIAACAVPLEIMRTCCAVIDNLRVFAEKGSKMAVSDAGAGAILAVAAIQAASLNVYINAASITDERESTRLFAEAQDLLSQYVKAGTDIYDFVVNELKK